MPERITTFERLKEWNENPTEELPIVYEWFLDWFFEQLVEGNIDLVREANEVHIKFCMICNNFNRSQAIERVNTNMNYYAGYSQKWRELLNEHKILTHV